MHFSIGDKIVYPYRGPGRIVDLDRKEFLEGEKQYYVINIPASELTVYVPARKAGELGMRPAMTQPQVTRVMDTMRKKPQQLPLDFKERQEEVWEQLKTGLPIPIARAVRDLTWRRHSAHLTKRDAELLQKGEELLAAEMALVFDIEIADATERIRSALDGAMAHWEPILAIQAA